MEALVKERDEMERRLLVDKDKLVLQLEEERRNMEKEKERFELQRRESEIREALMREKIEALVKEKDEMRRTFQADKDMLMVQLEDERRNTEKEKEIVELERRTHEAKKAQMREEIEALLTEKDEMKRTSKLMLQLEEERRNTQKEKERCDEMERRQEIARVGWIKHCDVLVQMIHEKEEMLEEITVEVEALKETVEELKQKARDLDPEMRDGLKEVDKRLRNVGPQWFQKLWKKNSIKRKEKFKKEIERLELQLKDSKAREARSTEVINVLVEERVKLKKQLEIGLMIDIFQGLRRSIKSQESVELGESKARESRTTEVINALVKERVDMKKRLWEEKERMALELEIERENMKKEKKQERFKLLKREREAVEAFMVEKLDETNRTFQAEKERLEQKILELNKRLEMAEEMEDPKRTVELKKEPGKEEALKKGHKKLKRFPLQCFQKLWMKDTIKDRACMEKERERSSTSTLR